MTRRRAGTGTIERTRDNRYRVRIPTEHGRRSLGVYATQAEAEAVLASAADRLAADDLTPGLTLAAWGRTVLDAREREGIRGIVTERNRWATHVLGSELAELELRTISRGDVLAWLEKMCAKRAADKRRVRKLGRVTISNALALVRAVLEAALERGALETNPARGARVPLRQRTTREPWTYLTVDEQRAILACTDEQIPAEARRLIAFAIGTGLRQGEQWALEVRDVHVEGDAPHVVVRFGSPGLPPKNGKIREVPLFGVALDAARAQLAAVRKLPRERNPHGLLWPSVRGCRRKGEPSSGYRRSKGEPAPWLDWLDAAGIRRAVRWHDLRHTCASSLISGLWGRAWRREDVQAMLGHTSASSTERYAHLAPTALRAAAAGMASSSPSSGPESPPAKPAAKPAPPSPLSYADPKSPVISGSHLRDLNSRPTVYETPHDPSDLGSLGIREARMRARRALEEAAAGRMACAIGFLAEILDVPEADADEGAA